MIFSKNNTLSNKGNSTRIIISLFFVLNSLLCILLASLNVYADDDPLFQTINEDSVYVTIAKKWDVFLSAKESQFKSFYPVDINDDNELEMLVLTHKGEVMLLMLERGTVYSIMDYNPKDINIRLVYPRDDYFFIKNSTGTIECLMNWKESSLERSMRLFKVPDEEQQNYYYGWFNLYRKKTEELTQSEYNDKMKLFTEERPVVEVPITASWFRNTKQLRNKNILGNRFNTEVTPGQPIMGKLVNLDDGVEINWYRTVGVQGYYVYRKIDGSGWKRIAKLWGGDKLSFTDRNVADYNGKLLTYVVRGFSGDSQGYYDTNGVSIYRLRKPSIIAKRNNQDNVKITWSRNGAASGYVIQYSTNSRFSWAQTIKITNRTVRSTDLNGLIKGKWYYIRIQSYRTNGNKNSYSPWTTTKVKIPIT